MPNINGYTGVTTKTISTGKPGSMEDDLYVLHNGSIFLKFGSKDRLVQSPMGWESLPLPPFDGPICSHKVVGGGSTICVSFSSFCDGFGTCCFDIVEREWLQACYRVLPFVGGVERPVRLAYQPPASSTFLSEQTSHQQPTTVLFSQNKPAPAISHQPNEQVDLELWLGLSPTRPYYLCATRDLSAMEDAIAMEKPPTLHTLLDLDTPKNWSSLRFKLLNLGGGRFFLAMVFEEVGDTEDEPDSFSDLEAVRPQFAVLTGVELVTSSSSGGGKLEGLQIVSHKSVRYMFVEDKFKWEL
jgi:hypothetical protein